MAELIRKPYFRGGLWLIALVMLYLVPVMTVNGAFDMFIKIEGIDGESRDSAHKDWIDVLSVSHGVTKPMSGAGAGRVSGQARFSEITLTKWIDKSSPMLMLTTCDGKVFPKVEIDLRGAAGNSQPYLTYELENVIVTSVKPSGSSGGADPVPTEEITLNFTKIEVRYESIDPASGETNFASSAACEVPSSDP